MELAAARGLKSLWRGLEKCGWPSGSRGRGGEGERWEERKRCWGRGFSPGPLEPPGSLWNS